ncbi:MAG: fatty acid kinase fatty acid binding subunit [Thermoleophilaceae bacterium]|nr:fatty acid kinase fatty acid binding subunit [Thermoleophilaceae bacterium]
MPNVAVVTDTTAYLPGDVVKANDIRLVSLYVNFGGERTVREADIADYDVFYEELRSAQTLPTTSQPSVGDFVSAYEPLLAEGRDVVSIHIAGGLSGTPESARQAKETLERDGRGGERVHVIDSTTSAGGLGLVALAAARRATQGAAADDVVETAESARANLKMWFSIDTLEFLKRGGRIGAASAWIGSTLKIKPLLSLENEITPVERVRTSKRAFERLVDYARQRQSSGANGWVVQHIQAAEAAAALADRCREVFEREPVFESEIGPVLGAHTGPGLLGVGSIPEQYLA